MISFIQASRKTSRYQCFCWAKDFSRKKSIQCILDWFQCLLLFGSSVCLGDVVLIEDSFTKNARFRYIQNQQIQCTTHADQKSFKKLHFSLDIVKTLFSLHKKKNKIYVWVLAKGSWLLCSQKCYVVIDLQFLRWVFQISFISQTEKCGSTSGKLCKYWAWSWVSGGKAMTHTDILFACCHSDFVCQL